MRTRNVATVAIASLRLDEAAEKPGDAALRYEVMINDAWQDIEISNNLDSLPPFTRMRVVMSGSPYAMPLLDTEQSTVTIFRPATEIKGSVPIGRSWPNRGGSPRQIPSRPPGRRRGICVKPSRADRRQPVLSQHRSLYRHQSSRCRG